MIITGITLNLADREDHKSIAIAMMNFWRYQYDKARDDLAHKRGLLNGALQANRSYELDVDARRQEDDNMGFGSYSDGQPPYSSSDMLRKQQDVEVAQTQAFDTQAMYDYYMTYVFNSMQHKAT
jgi:hypothetical protein